MNEHKTIATDNAEHSRASLRLDALLDDHSRQRSLRRSLIAIVLLVLIILVWAMLARVDELARARGEIQPGGHVRTLQTEEGGRILKLYVKEGETVKAGQLIADFAATDLAKLQRQIAIRVASLEIDRERMLAILEGRQPDFSRFEKDNPLLVSQANVAYRAEVASRNAALAAKRAEGSQQTELLGGSEQSKRLIATELDEARARLRRIEDAARKGVATQLALSEARQQVSSLEERQAEMTARAAGTRSTIGGMAAEVERVRAEMNQRLSLELSKTTEQYRELLAERTALEERQGRSDIISPIDGVVIDLPQTSEGAVVAAGGVVAEIVPKDEDIVLETMVSPRDIGFVQVGQRASVKIDSFDSARFGAVEGKVLRVAPTSTKLKENGMPFYKVDIALSKRYVGDKAHRLIPGMTGEADIATGSKSVMQYLLKPIFLSSDTAFHER